MTPVVTVAVPVFNDADHVGAALESVLGQSFRDFEVLVVDDGSTDRTLDVVYETLRAQGEIATSRVTVIRHQKNAGYGTATNTAIRAASGDWLTFVDADDTVEPRYLERMLDVAKETDAQLVFPRLRTIDAEGRSGGLQQWVPEERFSTRAEALRRSVMGELVESQHVLISRSLFEEVGSPVDNAYSDLLFMMAIMARARRIAYLDECLYNYAIHSGSVTGALRESVWDLVRLSEFIYPIIDANFDTAEAEQLKRHFGMQVTWQILQKATREKEDTPLRREVTQWARRQISIGDLAWLARKGKLTLMGSFALVKVNPAVHRGAYQQYKRLKGSIR